MFTNKTKITLLLSILSGFFTLQSHASIESDKFHNPFYIGLTTGYGSTTWGALLPKNQNFAMSVSTPTSVSEGGVIWGMIAGYEFVPQFALEGSYTRYPTAQLHFDSMSLFAYDYDGRVDLATHVESAALVAKLMLIVPHTSVRAFSSFGVAAVHRYDAIKNIWRPEPTFNAGFNYNFTDHWMGEVGINYTAGYGQAELDPTKDFVPFLYSVFLHVAYRF
jgi:hypothetical protein